MNKKRLVYILPLLILIVGIGVTYAWYSWSTNSDEETVIITNGVETATVYFDGGSDIVSDNLIPTLTKEKGIEKKIKIKAKESMPFDLSFNLYLDLVSLDEELKEVSFKYELYKNGTKVKEGNFSQEHLDNNLVECSDNNTSHIVLVENDMITKSLSEYTLYLWIDGNMDNPIDMGNKSYHFILHAEGSNAVMEEVKPIPLIEHISNLYKTGNPTLITHSKENGTNDTYYYSYQDADETWGLMNDGLKVSNTFGAGSTTITDTTALTTGTEGNIRYFGPSDKVNNYIYFNCNDYDKQSLTDINGNKNCELWRIIGIVDGKVKIIKNDSIGSLSWDQDKNQGSSKTTYSNNWETSSLQLFLNGLYYNRGATESHTYYSNIFGDTSTALDLKTIGITEVTRSNNMISESIWYLGGYTYSRIYPNQIYTYERTNTVGTTIYSGNPYTINANIGLMYVSDYGYGTNLTKCSRNLYYYISCSTNNWLYFGDAKNHQHFITPRSDTSYIAYGEYNGDVVADSTCYTHSSGHVHPVLYLNSELVVDWVGEGTSTNPYRISV